MTGTLSVVTIAAGRRDHLHAQAISLAAQTRPADHYVIVDMGGEPIDVPVHPDTDLRVVPLPVDGDLPLSHARNLGAASAAADTIVFLDVDCVITVDGLAQYEAHVAGVPAGVHCGPVGYLPRGVDATTIVHGPATLSDHAVFHDGRPDPHRESTITTRHELFWSLSFAVSARQWRELGGFDEGYVGYGGEDTDLAMRIRDARCPLWFHPDPLAFHQYHETSSPPIQHLASICRNAERFFARWRWWPMTGWLREFERLGLVEWSPVAGSIRPTGTSTS